VSVAQGVDVGTQAAQVNTTNFLYQPNSRTVNQELPPMLNTNDDENKREKEREAANRVANNQSKLMRLTD
jgi:hypothetical protein